MVMSSAVHAPALSLPEAAMLTALPKEKGDASVDASRGCLLRKDLGRINVSVGVLHDPDADLRPRGGENVGPVTL